jgi:iron complex transport system permease protein
MSGATRGAERKMQSLTPGLVVTARKVAAVTGGLGLLLVVVLVGALGIGALGIAWSEIVGALFHLGARGPSADVVGTVIFSLRMPRVLLGALAGAGLAMAGATFQSLSRNPLADPSILGVSSGAAFGVVVALVLGWSRTLAGYVGLSGFAFAGAVVAALAVYVLAQVDGRLPVATLLLAGVSVSVFFSSAITLLISIVASGELPGILQWLMGNLPPIEYGPLGLLAVAVTGAAAWLIREARALNLMALGEEAATQLGVESERVTRRLFFGGALLVGLLVAFSGPIGFVGLIVPHVARMLFGPDNRLLIPAAALLGGAFLVGADTVARTVALPGEIPVGVITAFAGTPFFIGLLRQRYRSLG